MQSSVKHTLVYFLSINFSFVKRMRTVI